RETGRSAAAVGARGQALTSLRPVGKVALDGDAPGVDHEARAESGLIEPGARVRVVEVQSGRLVVAADPHAGPEASA
ncbi:MAG: NfeD family protein, partial [Planctomycetota bacterium]